MNLSPGKLPHLPWIMKSRFRDFLGNVPLILRRTKLRARVLLNPISGEGKARKTLRLLRQQLKKQLGDYQVDIYFSRHPGDLGACARDAVDKNYNLVLIAGGDGAINETLQGMVGSDVPLGIIPRGTANIFAEEMGIPKDIEKAIEVIREGHIKRVDLGKANDRYFLWLSGIGVDALVAHEVHMDAKDRFGILAYVAFALKHARAIPSSRIKGMADGSVFDEQASAVFVGNTASYDGNIKIRATEQMDDGYFDVCVVRKASALFILRAILFFFLGRRAYYRDVKYLDFRYFKARELKVESNPPVYVHIDGEVLGTTPVRYQIFPKALSLILPERREKSLPAAS